MRKYLLKILDESVEISLSYESHNNITWFSYTSMITVKWSQFFNDSMNFNEMYTVDSWNKELRNEVSADSQNLPFCRVMRSTRNRTATYYI
jgi:hypothetical protein